MRLGYFTMPLHPPDSDISVTLEHDLMQMEVLDGWVFVKLGLGSISQVFGKIYLHQTSL